MSGSCGGVRCTTLPAEPGGGCGGLDAATRGNLLGCDRRRGDDPGELRGEYRRERLDRFGRLASMTNFGGEDAQTSVGRQHRRDDGTLGRKAGPRQHHLQDAGAVRRRGCVVRRSRHNRYARHDFWRVAVRHASAGRSSDPEGVPSHNTRPLASSTSAARESSPLNSSGSPTRPMSVQICAIDWSGTAIGDFCGSARATAGSRGLAAGRTSPCSLRSGRSWSEEAALANGWALGVERLSPVGVASVSARRLPGTSARIAVISSRNPTEPPAAAISIFSGCRFRFDRAPDALRGGPLRRAGSCLLRREPPRKTRCRPPSTARRS